MTGKLRAVTIYTGVRKAVFQGSRLPETILKVSHIMNTTNQAEQALMDYISDHKILNTHSHHLPEQAMIDFNLDKLIGNSYLQWQQVTPEPFLLYKCTEGYM